MDCPNCKSAMSAERYESHLHLPLAIDVCWTCRLIWFDQMESSQLAPGSVISLFKAIHEKRNLPATTVSMQLACPTCGDGLKFTQDIQRNGKFTYQRCRNGDGRLTSFIQFLREKSFVRNLNQMEVNQLSASVKQVKCSSCGGSIDITHDVACAHCGASIAVLDEESVNKALSGLVVRERQRITPNPELMGDALTKRRPYATGHDDNRADGDPASFFLRDALGDLVVNGIGALLSRIGK